MSTESSKSSSSHFFKVIEGFFPESCCFFFCNGGGGKGLREGIEGGVGWGLNNHQGIIIVISGQDLQK